MNDNFKSGRTEEQANAIRRLHKGLPIVEGKHNIPVFVNEDQAAHGKPGDPKECSLALGCKTQLGSTAVLIFRRVAYLDILDPETKKRTVWRMIVPQATLDFLIKPLDQGGKGASGVYWLNAPAPGQTLDHYSASRRALNERRKEALLRGEIIEKGHNRTGNRRSVVHPGTPGFLRDGSGMVQMTHKR